MLDIFKIYSANHENTLAHRRIEQQNVECKFPLFSFGIPKLTKGIKNQVPSRSSKQKSFFCVQTKENTVDTAFRAKKK